jgi:hypothetical protein
MGSASAQINCTRLELEFLTFRRADGSWAELLRSPSKEAFVAALEVVAAVEVVSGEVAVVGVAGPAVRWCLSNQRAVRPSALRERRQLPAPAAFAYCDRA